MVGPRDSNIPTKTYGGPCTYAANALHTLLNPFSTMPFFDACVPGGGAKFSPPLESQLFLQKNTIYHHEIKFCINSASF